MIVPEFIVYVVSILFAFSVLGNISHYFNAKKLERDVDRLMERLKEQKQLSENAVEMAKKHNTEWYAMCEFILEKTLGKRDKGNG